MAFTTWDSARNLNVSLDASRLTATATIGGGVFGRGPKTSGKYYYEASYGLWQGQSSGAGIASGSWTYQNNPSPFAALVIRNGTIQVNGVASGVTLGSLAAGTLLCFAIDLDAKLLWARAGATGNWNGSASANPATGAGGVSIAPLFVANVSMYPAALVGVGNDNITANFGASGFAGAVPSGFTAGWTDDGAAITEAVVTKAAAEVWMAPASPPVQVTMVGYEAWYSLVAALAVTKVGQEVWIDHAAGYIAPPGTGRRRFFLTS